MGAFQDKPISLGLKIMRMFSPPLCADSVWDFIQAMNNVVFLFFGNSHCPARGIFFAMKTKFGWIIVNDYFLTT